MKDLPTWSDLNKGVRKMTDKEFDYCEEMEKRKHDEKIRELEEQIEKMKLCANCKHCGVSGWCDKLNRYLLDKANQRCGNWEIKD